MRTLSVVGACREGKRARDLRQLVLEINTHHVLRGRGRDVRNYGSSAHMPLHLLHADQEHATQEPTLAQLPAPWAGLDVISRSDVKGR